MTAFHLSQFDFELIIRNGLPQNINWIKGKIYLRQFNWNQESTCQLHFFECVTDFFFFFHFKTCSQCMVVLFPKALKKIVSIHNPYFMHEKRKWFLAFFSFFFLFFFFICIYSYIRTCSYKQSISNLKLEEQQKKKFVHKKFIDLFYYW